MKLSEIEWIRIPLELKVVSPLGTLGEITKKWLENGDRPFVPEQWIAIEWADGEISHQQLHKFDKVEVYNCDLDLIKQITSLNFNEELLNKIKDLKRQITIKDKSLHEKNLALDAMHYVWCNGGCESGTHRWTEKNITEEIVQEAERNTKRLRQWFEANKQKKEYGKD